MSKDGVNPAAEPGELHFPVLHNANSSPPQVVLGPPSSQTMASSNDISGTTKPLTMFYNGSVTIFHLAQDKAEDIMTMAGQEEDDADGGGRRRLGVPAAAISANDGEELLAKLRQELPVASKLSLRRFFQKRKESYPQRNSFILKKTSSTKSRS